MEPEIKGRCPLCQSIGTTMQDRGYLICDGKRHFFPYRFYQCHRHGIFVWRGNKHELFDLSKRMNQVKRIEPLEQEVADRFEYMPTIADYTPTNMTCPNCNCKWTQHIGFLIGNKETVRCPKCGVEIPKEKAKKKDK